jgi:hypothetical protein
MKQIDHLNSSSTPSVRGALTPAVAKTEILALRRIVTSGSLQDVMRHLWRPLATGAIAMAFRGD